MTQAEVDSVAAGVADAIAVAVQRAIVPIAERVAALEARPSVKYCGIHREGERYAEGSLVTRGGSLWVAECETSNYPGGGRESGWRLVVKAGAA